MTSKIALLALIITGTAQAAGPCPSSTDLVAAGWIQHDSSEFPQTHARLTEKLRLERDSFKEDLNTNFDSPYLRKRIHFESWDDVRTPDLEMFGDVAFYSDESSGNPLEIRWYENNKKHFITALGECSCDEVPLAENALF